MPNNVNVSERKECGQKFITNIYKSYKLERFVSI